MDVNPSAEVLASVTGSYDVNYAKSGCLATADNDSANNQGQVKLYIGTFNPNNPTYSDEETVQFLKQHWFITGGAYSTMKSPHTGTIWARVNDVYPYQKSTNSYEMVLTTVTPNTQVSATTKFIKPIRDTLSVTVAHMYANSVGNIFFQKILRTMCVLYVATSFLLFIMGKVDDTVKNFTIRALKIGVVMALISPGSWAFFYSNLLTLFVEGQTFLVTVSLGETYGSTDMFAFVDKTINNYFTPKLWSRLQGMYYAKISGGDSAVRFYSIAWSGLLLWGALTYVYNICMAMMTYMLSLVAIAFMLSFAPMFIAFILFSPTKPWFDEYVKLLFMFAMQPIILFIIITFTNEVVLQLFAGAFSFTNCPTCIDMAKPIFDNVGLGWVYTLAGIPCTTVFKVAPDIPQEQITIMTVSIIAFVMMVKLMGQASGFAAMLSGYLTGTSEASSDLKLAGFDAIAAIKGAKAQQEGNKIEQAVQKKG